MIAGVWAPGAAENAENVLASISGIVGEKPVATAQGRNFMVARWALGVDGSVDATRQLVILGETRALPGSVDLSNASRLGGDYALIAGQPNGLVLARGHHAGRCLYYVQLSAGAVAVCSRLEPLVGCLRGGVTPNVRTLAALMMARCSDDLSATVFREVRRVEASESLLLSAAGVEERFRSNLEVTSRDGAPDDLAEELRRVIDRAILRSVESRRRVAVLVSGGLDSSSVLARTVAIARGANGPEVDAINWSFGGPGDDRPYLNELCESLGIIPIRVASTDASPYVARNLVTDAAPSLWATWAALFVALKRARDLGAEAILTGMGGDHVFNGDPRVFAQDASAGHWRSAIRSSSKFSGDSWATCAFRTARLLASPFVASFPPSLRVGRHHLAAHRWPWAGPRLREVVKDLYIGAPADTVWRGSTSVARFQRLVSQEFLHAAETRGQMEAATRLMRIDPLLDDEVVATVAGFPQRALLFGNRYRGLFRHAMRQRLPERLRLRPDKGRFEPAIAEVIRHSDLKRLRSLATMRMCGELNLVDPAKYYRHFEDVLAARVDNRAWPPLWPALTVEAFVRGQWGPEREDRRWSAMA